MGTSQADAFYLRWQNYESSLSECFRDLRSQSDFCDVTLVTSDCNGDTFRAHKLILSACSDFFKDILRQHPHSDPLIYLKGVSYDQLQSVLEFMYSGEVRISKEELNNFIAVAKELQIKGLNHHKGGVDESPNSRQSDFSPARKKIRKGNFKLKQKMKEEHDETMEVVTDDGPTGANVVIDEQASEDGESKEALLDDSGASGAAGEETNETLGEFIGDTSLNPETPHKAKRCRTMLSLESKRYILMRIDSGESMASISRSLGLSDSTVRGIKQDRESILEHSKHISPAAASTIVRSNPLIINMECLLSEWIDDQSKIGISLSSHGVRNKAKEIYDELASHCPQSSKVGQQQFVASKGWYHKFLKRQTLKNDRIVEETNPLDFFSKEDSGNDLDDAEQIVVNPDDPQSYCIKNDENSI